VEGVVADEFVLWTKLLTNPSSALIEECETHEGYFRRRGFSFSGCQVDMFTVF
jgi:hypothetical protein